MGDATSIFVMGCCSRLICISRIILSAIWLRRARRLRATVRFRLAPRAPECLLAPSLDAGGKCNITLSSPYALSCSATSDEGLRRVTMRTLSSLSSSIPATSANETSAKSKVNRTPALKACKSQALRSSSTQPPVNLPSTLSLTAIRDDSTTDIFISSRSPLGAISSRHANNNRLRIAHRSGNQGPLPLHQPSSDVLFSQ